MYREPAEIAKEIPQIPRSLRDRAEALWGYSRRFLAFTVLGIAAESLAGAFVAFILWPAAVTPERLELGVAAINLVFLAGVLVRWSWRVAYESPR